METGRSQRGRAMKKKYDEQKKKKKNSECESHLVLEFILFIHLFFVSIMRVYMRQACSMWCATIRIHNTP